jgi:hypothetical protein
VYSTWNQAPSGPVERKWKQWSGKVPLIGVGLGASRMMAAALAGRPMM